MFDKFIEAARQGNLAEVKAIATAHPAFINRRDDQGATALHYAALGAHRDVVEALLESGADINITDSHFGATPTGWAIEYLREKGGFLAIELADFAHAIRRGDAEWVLRFLTRFPSLRHAHDSHGKSFKLLARESGHVQIAILLDKDTAA